MIDTATYSGTIESNEGYVRVAAEVTCTVETMQTHKALSCLPNERTDHDEHEVLLRDIRLSACRAEADGVAVPWCDEYTDAIVSALIDAHGADDCDEPETIEETTDE